MTGGERDQEQKLPFAPAMPPTQKNVSQSDNNFIIKGVVQKTAPFVIWEVKLMFSEKLEKNVKRESEGYLHPPRPPKQGQAVSHF